MTRTILILTLLFACGFANSTAPAPTEPEPPKPVAAVTYVISYPTPNEKLPRRLITGVWSDGTVVTSGNRETGGPPYTSRKIDPAKVKSLAADLDALKFFTDEELKKQPNRYPPDASYTAVGAAFAPDKVQRLALWRAPTTQPANADRFVQVFIKARALINKFGEEKGKPVETIDEGIFNVGSPKR
jgi:hypothetical protein